MSAYRQTLVDQTPRYRRALSKDKRIMSKAGIIRMDKRKQQRPKFLK